MVKYLYFAIILLGIIWLCPESYASLQCQNKTTYKNNNQL